MNDRKTVLALFVAAVFVEALLIVRGGILGWFNSGPHTPEQLREMILDWRVFLSVALVSVILWLGVRWFRLGTDRAQFGAPGDTE